MKERFSKARMLLVLETLIRQSALEFEQRGFGDITQYSYAQVESFGPAAIRCYAEYQDRRAMKFFIEGWKIQSDKFLDPDHVRNDD